MKKLVIWAVLITAVSYGGAKLYLHHKVTDSLDQAVTMARMFAEIDYDHVRSTITGELTVEDVRIKLPQFNDGIVIDRIGIDTPSFFSLLSLTDLADVRSGKMPDYMAFLMQGLHVPISADWFRAFYDMSIEARGIELVDLDMDAAAKCTGRYGFSPGTLSALGYTEQNISMRMAMRNERGEFALDIDANVEDMWAADATVTLAGNMMAEVMRGGGARPRLSDLDIIFTDLSLKDRIRRYCADEGLTAEEILTAQIDTFKHYGESNGIVFDEYMLEPYREFLEGGSVFRIRAEPTNPVAMSQLGLYKPSDVPALLNLTASVE